MADIVLDASHMTVDKHGVKDLVWPLAREEVLAMRDALLPPLVAIARGSADVNDVELFSILLVLFAKEAMAVYQVHALSRRSAELGHRPIAPVKSRLLPALAASIVPPPPPFLESLRAGPPRPLRRWASPALRRMWRFVRFAAHWNRLSPRGLLPIDPEHDIVATQVSPLISCHARAVSDIVKYSSLGDWFAPLDKRSERGASRAAASTAVIDTAIEAINVGFAAGNEELSDCLTDYLRDWLAKAMGLVYWHLNALLQRPDRLPRRLWTGTGGNIWTRILCHATRRVGGMVTGHDHGIGAGHLVSPVKTLNDFESCDVFVTFTKAQATALQRGLRTDLLIPPRAPKIIAVPSCRRTSTLIKPRGLGRLRSQPRLRSSVIRRVMYPSSFYNGERMHFVIQIPDLVQVDWEARLFSQLAAWGYEVLHKPHPQSITLPPVAFANELGVRILTQPFEGVMDMADVLIFVSSRSTAFANALASDKPIVFIDLGLFDWVSEAYDMLKRRCRVVRGWFDEANRAQVDWEELHRAIDQSRDLMDTAFVDAYLRIEFR